MLQLRHSSSDNMFGNDDCCSQKTCAQRAFFLQQRVDFLSEALSHVDSNLKYIERIGQDLSKDEILNKIKTFPDIRELLNQKSESTISDSNIFSQKQSQVVTCAGSTLSIDSLNKIYEVPVELDVKKRYDADIYEVPVQLQIQASKQDLQNFFGTFKSWSELTPSLKKSIEQLLKSNDSLAANSEEKRDKKSDFNSIDMSFAENEKNQICQMDNSFSISSVGKKSDCETVQTQTQAKLMITIQVQTTADQQQIQSYRLQSKDGLMKTEEWVDVEFSLHKIEKILHQIPTNIVQKQSAVEFGIQTQIDHDYFYEESSEVNTILEEVDGVLGSIQQMLYELPSHRFTESEENAYQPDVYVLDSPEVQIEQKVDSYRLSEEDMNTDIMEEAKGAMGKIQKILYEFPSEYKPVSTFKSIELIDQIVQTMKQKEVESRDLFEIPVEIELMQESEKDQTLQHLQYEEKEKLWDDVALTFSNIERLLEKPAQVPEQQNFNYDYSELNPSLEPELSNSFNQYDEYMENVKKFRIQTEEQLGNWDEIQGAMSKIQNMFSELPVQIQPNTYSIFQPIEQMFSVEQQTQTLFEEQIGNFEFLTNSDYEEECKQKKSQIEKDWLEIDGALESIQKALYQIPIYPNNISDQIQNKEITHQSFLLNNYDVPVDIQIQSNCDSDQKNIEENVIRQTIGQVIENCQPKETGLSIRINQYDLPVDIEIQSEPWNIKLTRLLEIDEQVCNQVLSRPIKKQLQFSGIVSEGILLPDCKDTQVFEIPYELEIVNRINNLEVDQAIIQLAIVPEENVEEQIHERDDESRRQNITDSLDQYQNPEVPELETSLENLQLNFDNFHKTPRRNALKSVNTNRNMNSSKNRSNWIQYNQSEGNLTDRSMLLRRNGMNNAFETPVPSLLMKEESINPTSYYELLETNNQLQEHLNRLMNYINDADRQICELKENSKKQKSFIAAIKTYHERQIKSHKNQIYSYEGMISEITEKYEKESEKSEEFQKTIEDLTGKINELQKVIVEKLEMINNTHDSFEDERCELWTTIRRLRLDLDESEAEKQNIRKEYESFIESMKTEIQIKDDELIWLRKDNEKLKSEIEFEKSGSIDSKNKMVDLLGRVELAMAEQSSSQELQAIYLGQFKKAQGEIEELDYLVLQLKSNNQVLENKIEDLIKEKTEMIKIRDEEISRLEQLVSISEQELSKKFSILPHVQNQLDFLRKQLVVVTEQSLVKQKEILELNIALESMKDRSVKSLSINFMGCSEDNSTSDGNHFEKGSYVKQLEEIIFQYEHIITRNQNTIKDLQEQVYDYLGEALEKEEQFENLCEGIFNDVSDWDQISGDQGHDDIDEAVDKFNSGMKFYGAKRSSLNQNGISTEETLIGCLNKNQHSQSQEEGALFLNMNGSANRSKIQANKKMGSGKKNQTLQYSRKMIY